MMTTVTLPVTNLTEVSLLKLEIIILFFKFHFYTLTHPAK